MRVGDEQSAIELCRRLLQLRGEASAIVIADEIISRFESMDNTEQLGFLLALQNDFQPQEESLRLAAESYLSDPSAERAAALSNAARAPRLNIIRSLSTSPSGVPALIRMRAELLSHLRANPELALLDDDMARQFRAWFNRGFLELRRIDWQTPAHILEKLIAYEAVHEIRGWDDLRRRLADDRRCFAFFHPALADEPLVFVQVALTESTATAIGDILDEEPPVAMAPPSTAVFYSISNCQQGLRGVSFGNFLIKQVLVELQQEFPSINNSITLSPVPNFRQWLKSLLKDEAAAQELGLSDDRIRSLQALEAELDTDDSKELLQVNQKALMRLCASFLINEKRGAMPRDAVARFHLSNGARLDQINWAGDLSALRLEQSYGILVNYLYEADQLETNHEQLVNNGVVACSTVVRKMAEGK